MPLYNYECQACAKRFEEIVAYDKRESVVCPDCQGKAKVLVSGFAVKAGGSAGATPARSPFS